MLSPIAALAVGAGVVALALLAGKAAVYFWWERPMRRLLSKDIDTLGPR